MIDVGKGRDPLLAVVDALNECTCTMERLAAVLERVDGVAVAAHSRDPRTPDRPLPAGMTAWVTAMDVARAVKCSRSKAHEYLRAAAGRSVGTGRILRVPVDVWEVWARDNLIDALGRRHRRSGWLGVPPSAAATPQQGSRRDLGPLSRAVSKLPLIPLLTPAKRR